MEITRETRIAEIIENCPQAMPAFMEIGMHCMGCALASGETLEPMTLYALFENAE